MNDLIGQTLGPYQILEQLGQGGMATVYKAYHPAMDRYVAVKVLPRHMAGDPQFRARFQREARTIAKLEHRYILPVHDTGEQEGIHYMVMRYTDGGTMSDLIANGKLTVERATTLVAQVAEALSYAHQNGVVHRDIKPANILISREGDALLSDFGIARIIEGTMQLTSDGMLIGTPYYMAPEQVQGQPSDARSDLYALGVVLYEALTGRRPYEAETPLAVALMHVHNPLPPPRQLRPDLPEALERVILRAMAKNPTDRFQNADQMAAALRGEPVTQPTPTAPIRPSETLVLPNDATTVGLPAQAKPVVRTRSRWLLPVVIGVILAMIGVSALFIRRGIADRIPTRLAGTRVSIEPTALPVDSSSAGEAPVPAPAIKTPTELTVFNDSSNTNSVVVLGTNVWAGTVGGLVVVADGNRQVFTAADGLPFTNIYAIIAESDSILWLAGEYDLARVQINGNTLGEITTFTRQELGLDYVRAFYRANDGALLAAGYLRSGLVRWDGSAWAAYGPALSSDNGGMDGDITALAQASDGALYIAGNEGLLRWDGTTVLRYSEEQGVGAIGVRQLLVDTQQHVWAAAGEHGLLRLNTEQNRWERITLLDDAAIQAIVQLQDGRLGAASAEQIAESSDNGTTWRSINGTITEFGYQPQVITQGADGTIWVGSTQGIASFRASKWNLVRPTAGLPDNTIGPLIIQDDQLYVVPRYGGQIMQIDSAKDTLTELHEVYGRALAFTADSIWYGNTDGLFRRQGQALTQFSKATGLPDDQVYALLATDSTLWVGTRAGLVSLDLESGKLSEPVPAFAGAPVETLYQAPDGSIWAGTTTDGVAANPTIIGHYDGDTWQIWKRGEAAFLADASDVSAFIADPDGIVWVAIWNSGLWHLEGSEWARLPSNPQAPQGNVLALTEHDDAIWAAGQLGALYRWSAGAWEKVDLHGIPSQVNSLNITKDDTIWLGTNEGVLRYR